MDNLQTPECPYIVCSKAYLMFRGYWSLTGSDPIYASEDAYIEVEGEGGIESIDVQLTAGDF